MAHKTPIVYLDTLTYHQNGQKQQLSVGTPEWYAWLTTATSFALAVNILCWYYAQVCGLNTKGVAKIQLCKRCIFGIVLWFELTTMSKRCE
jgi:hypothetical protein